MNGKSVGVSDNEIVEIKEMVSNLTTLRIGVQLAAGLDLMT